MIGRQAVARAVRRYATSSQQQSVQPPIQLSGLSGKYASALYSAAAKKNTLKQVEGDLSALSQVIKAEPKVRDFLNNPVLSSKDRSAGLDELLKKAAGGKQSHELTKNLFDVLAENGRLYEAERVIADFLEVMVAHRGEVKVTITTAQPLDKDLQKRLEDSLKQSQLVSAGGKTLTIENKVQEGLLGGLMIDFGDKTIDLSVASRVRQLDAALSESV